MLLGEFKEIKQRLAEQPELLNEQVEKETPLMAAAYDCQIEIFEFLLSKGADIYVRDSYNENVLQMLIIKATWVNTNDSKRLDYYFMIEMLLRRDAELRADNPRLTPLLTVREGEENTAFGRAWLWPSEKQKPVIEKVRIMAKAAEVQVQRERTLAEREQEHEGRHHRGASYFSETPPKILGSPSRKPSGFARLLARFGIGWRTKESQLPEPENAPLLGEEKQGKLKVS